jgi:hypothetical protein
MPGGEWIVTGPGGQRTVLQIVHFDRNRNPVPMGVGPVLNPLDAIASKVSLALPAADRSQTRRQPAWSGSSA